MKILSTVLFCIITVATAAQGGFRTSGCYNEKDIPNCQDSILIYNDSIRISTDKSFYYYMRGHCEFACRNVPMCIQSLDTAIALNPALAPAYCERAMAYHDIGLMREALKDAHSAVNLDSTKELHWARLANVYGAFKLTDSVPYAVGRALQINPNYYWAICIKASYYKKIDRLTEALIELGTAIKLSPEKSYAYNIRGGVYGKMEKYKDALADLDKALKIDTCLKELYFEKGYYNYKLGRLDQAMQWLNVAIQKQPRDIYAYYYRAWLYEKKEEKDKAGNDFLQAAVMGHAHAAEILERRYPDYYKQYQEQRKK